jgi:DNA-binding IclR family transcriptional regulator
MQAIHRRSTKPKRDPHGIQSVDNAVKVLLGVEGSPGPISLKDLSARIGMPPSNVHRYLHSLTANGLVSQEIASGKYSLGMFAARLGLAALQRIELINNAADRLHELATQVRASVSMSVWSPRGPTVIRWEHHASVIEVFGVGSVMPLLWSATGMVFLSYLEPAITSVLVEQQLEKISARPGQTRPDIAAIIASVREKKYAITRGGVVGGLTGIAAPLFGWQNEVIAAIAVVTETGDPAVELQRVPALLDFTTTYSGVEIDGSSRKRPATATQISLKRELGKHD